MLEQVKQNVGAQPQAVSADNGYWNGKQVGDARVQGIDLYVATGKQKHGEPNKAEDEDATESNAEAGLLEQMKQKLKTQAGRDLYRRRKAIVEPVFGQIKEWRGFRRFLLRGLQKVRAEWKLICLTHNLLKLFRSGRALLMFHTVEVTGSNPVAPTNRINHLQSILVFCVAPERSNCSSGVPQIIVLWGNPIHPDRHMDSRDHAGATRYGPGSRAPMHRALRRESSAPAAVAPAASLQSAPAYRPRG